MSTSQEPMRLALIGSGQRARNMYVPIVQALPDDVQVVSVWSRTEQSARPLATELGVPWYTDMDRMVQETAPEIGIVSVSYAANGEVGCMALEHGMHVLIETPIAWDLREADAMIATAAARGLKIEVAEQYHRHPLEQIKLKLLASGLFGRVYASFNDLSCHGYHGVSLMRSYLGFDAVPTRVSGSVQNYDLIAHWSYLTKLSVPRRETQEHALVEFEGGQVGVFHWTSVGYDSALRWWRSSRFLAEKGMGIAVGVGPEHQEKLTLLAPGGEGPRFITVERRHDRDDCGALTGMVAHTGDPELPIVRWDNPFRPAKQGRAAQWYDDEIGVAGCLLSLVEAVRNGTEPSYGPLQARLDQEITLAMRLSARNGGEPVSLPLDRDQQPL
ncbi:MAG: Gfo/Idh/MocA family protein [Anaerolineae bacterium]